MSEFELISNFEPAGDQPQAIAKLCQNLLQGKRHNVLLGVTGSGKTFTMAHVIARLNKPTLVLAPNKTLAVQLGVIGFQNGHTIEVSKQALFTGFRTIQ